MRLSLHRWRAPGQAALPLLPMLETVWCPRDGLEPLRLYLRAIDHTPPEGARVDAGQGGAYLGEDGRIGLRQREGGIFGFVGEGQVAGVRLIRDCAARALDLTGKSLHQFPLEVEQPPPEVLDVHGCLAGCRRST